MTGAPNHHGRRLPAGATGFLMIFAPLALIVLPLFFQRSGYPRVGPYSMGYFVMLVGASALVTAVAGILGWFCHRRGDLRPAQAALAALAALAVILVVAEAVSRLAHPDAFAGYAAWGDRRSLEFGFEPGFNRHWTAAGATYSTDRFGFRTHVSDTGWDAAPARAGDARARLFVLGGSSAFGFGLNDDQTWAQLLEQRLRAALPQHPPTVINAGANGFNSLQSVLRFYLRVQPHRPTHLVYYEVINDVRPAVRTIDDEQISEAILFSTTLHDYIAKVNRGKNFYARTNLGYFLGRLVDRWFSLPRDSSADDPYRLHPEILVTNGEHYLRNLRALADMCRRNHVRLVLVTFLDDSAALTPRYRAIGVSYYNQLLRGLAASEGVELVDVARDFAGVEDKAPYFFADHYHPSPRGAAYIAEHVATALAPALGSGARQAAVPAGAALRAGGR
jgi:lysophospholipase L1-like esterase